MYRLKQPLGSVPRKKMLLKFENIKGDEWYNDDGKNIQKLLRVRLLGFLQFHIQMDGMQVLQNPWEILVKGLFY